MESAQLGLWGLSQTSATRLDSSVHIVTLLLGGVNLSPQARPCPQLNCDFFSAHAGVVSTMTLTLLSSELSQHLDPPFPFLEYCFEVLVTGLQFVSQSLRQ